MFQTVYARQSPQQKSMVERAVTPQDIDRFYTNENNALRGVGGGGVGGRNWPNRNTVPNEEGPSANSTVSHLFQR